MARLGEDFFYKKVNNFFSEEELKFLDIYTMNALRKFENITSGPDEWAFQPAWGEDAVMQTFLESKLPLVEKESNVKLYPTYSFWRYYVFGGKLAEHTDRPSCEISITACMQKLSDWPIVVGNTSIELKPGEAVLYSGCAIPHSRPGTYTGEGLAQVFLHYVDKGGPFTHHRNDAYLKFERSKQSPQDALRIREMQEKYKAQN